LHLDSCRAQVLKRVRKRTLLKMKIISHIHRRLWLPLLLCFIAAPLPGAQPMFDTARIEQITGLKGAYSQAENVFKLAVPRTDAQVKVDQWTLPPFMGLTSWAAFTPGRKKDFMVMGDLVLFADEVNPVMSVAFANGLDVAALHNHFFYGESKVYFMHVAGEGPVEKLAEAVRRALDRVRQIRAARP